MREEAAGTFSVLIAADIFLDPKHAESQKDSLAKAMTYLGSNLGMTLKDLQLLAPKLASNISTVLGSSEGSRKRPSAAEEGDRKKEVSKRKKAAGEPKAASKKRKGRAEEEK